MDFLKSQKSRNSFHLFSGNADVILCAGFEKMAAGSLEKLASPIDDRALSVDKHIEVMSAGVIPTFQKLRTS